MKMKGGWSTFQAFLATVGRLVSRLSLCAGGKRELSLALLVSFCSVSVIDVLALVRCRFLLIRSHVACIFNHTQNKKTWRQ